jgi:putative transcriptional regulator
MAYEHWLSASRTLKRTSVPLDSDEIAEIRKTKLNLTQVQFAQLLGVHPLTVSKWERGELKPTPHQESMMESFRTATKKNEDIGEQIGTLLVTAGVVFATFVLLNAAFGKKK